MAASTFLRYAWLPLPSAGASYNALNAIRLARGGVQTAGGVQDDAVGAGVATAQDGSCIFMWAGGFLGCFDIAANLWRGPVPLPASAQPGSFAPLYRGVSSMFYNGADGLIYHVNFSTLRCVATYPGATRFESAVFGSFGGTLWRFVTSPPMWTCAQPGLAIIPIHDIFASSLLLVFDYRYGSRAVLLGVIKVSNQLVDFTINAIQTGSIPGTGGIASGCPAMPGRVYSQASGNLTTSYRDVSDILASFNLILPIFPSGCHFDNAATTAPYYTTAHQMNGFTNAGDLGVFNATDTNWERSVNGLINPILNGARLAAAGGSNIEFPVQGGGGVLAAVNHVPFSLENQAFGTPLTANVPAGFSPHQAWAVFAMAGSAAILDDTGAFYFLTLAQYDVARFQLRNWAKDIRA